MDYVSIMSEIIRHSGLVIEYIGLGIVVASVIISIVRLLQPQFTMEHVRHHLARRIIFGLEFVIAADILLVTVATDIDQVIQLGAIVAIRVLLGYSLRKEAAGV